MSKFTHTAESRPLEGYTIKRPLHRGGFGEVYFAVSDGGRDVALKLLQHNVDVELRGVQQCLNLSHPNLVTIFDVRQDGDGDYWIVMEYVPGETLDELLRRENRPLPMQEVLRWMRGLCAGVTYMHERGIVHRDLKPSNIFGAGGTVKIGDIGLSKFITASRRSAHTESVGTVYYMAPEIARGRYGNEVDIYAIGIIAYELLSGNVPFDGESAGEILMKHLTQPPNLKAVPERLRPVIQRALAKAPQQRQRSVAAFLNEFEAAVVGRGESARAQPTIEAVEQELHTETGSSASEYAFGGRLFPYTGRLIGMIVLLLVLGVAVPLPGLIIVAAGLAGLSLFNFRYAHGAGRYLGGMKRHFTDAGNTPLEKRKAPHLRDRITRDEIVSQDFLLRDNSARPAQVSVEPAPFYGHWGILLLIGGGMLAVLCKDLDKAPQYREHPMAILVFGGAALAMVAATTKTMQFGAGVVRSISGQPPRTRPIHPAVANSHLVSTGTSREQWSSFSTSAFLSPLTVTALTGAMSLVQPDLLQVSRGDLSVATLFVTVATVGVWMISLISSLTAGKNWDKWPRRGMFGAAGLVTGTAAYGLWDMLFKPGTSLLSTAGQSAMFQHFGSHSLTNANMPTLAGFLCFFGFFFAIINWTKQTNPLRASRWRLWPVIVSMLAAMATSQVFEFSTLMASLWAVVISSAAQLASPATAKPQG